jgi:DNA-binding NarL/FixJ family response regulator
MKVLAVKDDGTVAEYPMEDDLFQPREPRMFGLTDRQLEVLAGMIDGKENKEIADDLLLSVKVKVHVTAILRTMRVTNRTQAAVTAVRMEAGSYGHASSVASFLSDLQGAQFGSRVAP